MLLPARMPERTQEQGPTTRLGEACILSLLAAVVASVPAALRVARAGAGFFEALLACTAIVLPPLVMLLVVARGAARGFRALAGPGSLRGAALGIALWLGLSGATLALLGAVLKATTHHRGLGGGAFALLGGAAVVAAAVLAYRLILLGRRAVARGVPSWVAAAVAASVLIALVVLARSVLVDAGETPAVVAVRAAVLDGAVVVVAAAACSPIEISGRIGRFAQYLGVPIVAMVVLAGLLRVEASPGLARALRAGGGLSATLLGVFDARNDRASDGGGAAQGGHDE